jgi:hypothetical protein
VTVSTPEIDRLLPAAIGAAIAGAASTLRANAATGPETKIFMGFILGKSTSADHWCCRGECKQYANLLISRKDCRKFRLKCSNAGHRKNSRQFSIHHLDVRSFKQKKLHP